MSESWKRDHANLAEQYAKHEMIEDVLSEFASNMGFERKGLPEYGLSKIVMYVSQIVLARARGIEPEMLRMDDDEFSEHQRRLLEIVLAADKPAFIIGNGAVIKMDGSDRP